MIETLKFVYAMILFNFIFLVIIVFDYINLTIFIWPRDKRGF